MDNIRRYCNSSDFYSIKSGKNYKLAMAIRLSFTALTLCAEHSLISGWVKIEEWGVLLEVVPSMEKVL